MPPKIIFVGGVGAVGKSSVAAVVTEKLNGSIPGQVEHIETGTELRKAAQEKFGKHVNDLNQRQLAQVRSALYKRVAASKAKVVLFVDHYTYAPKTSLEQLEIITPNRQFARYLSPHVRHFVLIESPLKTVRLRRIIEGTTKPRPIGEDNISRGIVSQRFIARAVAREQRKPLTIVENQPGKMHMAARRIEIVVKRHLT